MQLEMVWCIRVRNALELCQCFGMVDWWRLTEKKYRLEWARHSPRTRLVDLAKWLVKIYNKFNCLLSIHYWMVDDGFDLNFRTTSLTQHGYWCTAKVMPMQIVGFGFYSVCVEIAMRVWLGLWLARRVGKSCRPDPRLKSMTCCTGCNLWIVNLTSALVFLATHVEEGLRPWAPV